MKFRIQNIYVYRANNNNNNNNNSHFKYFITLKLHFSCRNELNINYKFNNFIKNTVLIITITCIIIIIVHFKYLGNMFSHRNELDINYNLNNFYKNYCRYKQCFK